MNARSHTRRTSLAKRHPSFYKGAKLITKGTVVTDHISDGLLVFLHHNPKDREVRSVINEEIGNPSIT